MARANRSLCVRLVADFARRNPGFFSVRTKIPTALQVAPFYRPHGSAGGHIWLSASSVSSIDEGLAPAASSQKGPRFFTSCIRLRELTRGTRAPSACGAGQGASPLQTLRHTPHVRAALQPEGVHVLGRQLVRGALGPGELRAGIAGRTRPQVPSQPLAQVASTCNVSRCSVAERCSVLDVMPFYSLTYFDLPGSGAAADAPARGNTTRASAAPCYRARTRAARPAPPAPHRASSPP